MHATTPSSQPPQTCKVVIIGAGFAGLAAGTTLCNNNRHLSKDASDHISNPHFTTEDVVILEASNRVGGRAHTLPISSTLSVELGCTWIHGIGTKEDPNPILAAAAGLMSTLKPQKWWGSTFLLPGRKEELSKEQKLLIHKAIEAYAAAVDGIETKEESTTSGSGGRNDGEPKNVVGAAVDAAWLKFLQTENLEHVEKQTITNTSITNSSLTSNNTSLELARAAWQWREQLQRAIDGCNSTSDMDASARSLYTEFGGSEVHAPIPCGYQKVAEALALGRCASSTENENQPPSQALNIKFNHQVERIEWSNSENDAQITITCTNGARFQASTAIVTTSLGVLKQQHDKMFSPKLPERKVQAIERLKIGVVDKIIIDFSHSTLGKEEEGEQEVRGDAQEKEERERDGVNFFEEADFEDADQGVVTYALLWENEELSSQGLPEWAKGIFSIRWGGPEFKRRRKGGKKNEKLEEENGFEGDEEQEEEEEVELLEDEENEDIVAFSAAPRYSQAVMWITGDAARSMEAASDTQVLETIQTIFKKFPGIALPLKNITSDVNNNINEDDLWGNAKLIRSQWGMNPFTAGSYSYVGPKGSPDDVVALAAPIMESKSGKNGDVDKPVLLFAGEACHVKYIGTTHAAYLTGKDAAELLLKEENTKICSR